MQKCFDGVEVLRAQVLFHGEEVILNNKHAIAIVLKNPKSKWFYLFSSYQNLLLTKIVSSSKLYLPLGLKMRAALNFGWLSFLCSNAFTAKNFLVNDKIKEKCSTNFFEHFETYVLAMLSVRFLETNTVFLELIRQKWKSI